MIQLVTLKCSQGHTVMSTFVKPPGSLEAEEAKAEVLAVMKQAAAQSRLSYALTDHRLRKRDEIKELR